MTQVHSSGKCIFVGSFPGIELRTLGWINKSKPVIFLLTDGSGSKGRSNLGTSLDILEMTGADRGAIFGRYSDQEIYARLRGHDHWFFVSLADELAFHILENKAVRVVCGLAEGFNPIADAMRMVVDTAIGFASQRGGRSVDNYSFNLVGEPEAELAGGSMEVIELDDEWLRKKLDIASVLSESNPEVANILSRLGEQNVRREVIGKVTRPFKIPTVDPGYEKHGMARVGAGIYQVPIRYADHMAPLVWALRSQLEGPMRSAA